LNVSLCFQFDRNGPISSALYAFSVRLISILCGSRMVSLQQLSFLYSKVGMWPVPVPQKIAILCSAVYALPTSVHFLQWNAIFAQFGYFCQFWVTVYCELWLLAVVKVLVKRWYSCHLPFPSLFLFSSPFCPFLFSPPLEVAPINRTRGSGVMLPSRSKWSQTTKQIFVDFIHVQICTFCERLQSQQQFYFYVLVFNDLLIYNGK